MSPNSQEESKSKPKEKPVIFTSKQTIPIKMTPQQLCEAGASASGAKAAQAETDGAKENA